MLEDTQITLIEHVCSGSALFGSHGRVLQPLGALPAVSGLIFQGGVPNSSEVSPPPGPIGNLRVVLEASQSLALADPRSLADLELCWSLLGRSSGALGSPGGRAQEQNHL